MARPSPTPGSQASLREANRTRVVDALKRHGSLTQVELAGSTGLSPATVSNIVRELTAAGVLSTARTSRSGRRAVSVTLARRFGLVGAVHISARRMRVVLADVAQTVVASAAAPLARDHRHDVELDRAALLLSDLCASLGVDPSGLLAVGAALPAPVDPVTGRIATPQLLPGWRGVDVRASLESRLGVTVRVDGEANLGGLWEARSGAAAGTASSAYVRVGHTISAALIHDGEPLRGAHGKAGQLGHVSIDENGPVCSCGNRGCLETFAGGRALMRLFPADGGVRRLSDLLRGADEGDPTCRRVVADAGRHIGVAVAGLTNLFDPERVVVGGELAGAGEILLAPLRHSLERSTLSGSGSAVEVVAATAGDDAEVRGAVALAVGHTRLDAATATAAALIPAAAG